MRRQFLPLILLPLISFDTYGGEHPGQKPDPLTKIMSSDTYAPFLINNIFNYYGNNGGGSFDPTTSGNEGFEFPKGELRTMVFEDGVVWGGYHKGRTIPKVGGSVYLHGLQAGPILVNGTETGDPLAADPSDPSFRLYRVRPDINPGADSVSAVATLENDEQIFIARHLNVTAHEIYDQYIKDWNEWPANLGAPYKDVDTNGVYDPTIDIPGMPGADQTLWYVANDCDSVRVTNLAGCPLIGLEMQRTIWGYKSSGALDQVIFLNTLLINKSGAAVDSMFLIQWADPDVGSGGDDLVGCDTARNLGYAYNGGAVDANYGSAVPAGGFMILQGPIVPSQGDIAIFKMKYRQNFRNLKMSAYPLITRGFVQFLDPRQGAGANVQWFNLMRGLAATTGNPFVDPTTGLPTKICFPGDPVRATDGSAGWVDGTNGLRPADRRMCLVMGPFTMAAGDTQELVVANMAGRGADRLSSITVLRSVADQVLLAFRGMVTTDVRSHEPQRLPRSFALQQNYPNPFNPSTTISYQLGESGRVRLQVFDILGREVTTLTDGMQGAGPHVTTFDASRLASGVYIYRLSVQPSGSGTGFTAQRMMVLLR